MSTKKTPDQREAERKALAGRIYSTPTPPKTPTIDAGLKRQHTDAVLQAHGYDPEVVSPGRKKTSRIPVTITAGIDIPGAKPRVIEGSEQRPIDHLKVVAGDIRFLIGITYKGRKADHLVNALYQVQLAIESLQAISQVV